MGEINSKHKVEEEPHENEVTMEIVDEANMEIDIQKDDTNLEEQVMKCLLSEWGHLDERFILEDKRNYIKRPFKNIRPSRVW